MRKRSEVAAEATPEATKIRTSSTYGVVGAKDSQTPSVPAAKAFTFASANAATETPLHSDFQRIVETVFVEHPLDDYKRLEQQLKGVGPQRNDHGAVNQALDEAEGNARLAHRLWITAKDARSKWEMANDVIFSAMRQEATRMLQHEKSSGLRNKMITDQDVDDMAAVKFGDEWMNQQVARRRTKLMEDSMQNLAEMWSSRCRSLQAMLSKLR